MPGIRTNTKDLGSSFEKGKKLMDIPRISFTEKLITLHNEAMEYIRSILQKRGGDYQLIDPAEYDEEISENVYDLPHGWGLGKHEWFFENPIISIDIDDKGKLTFKGLGVGDYEDHDYSEDDLHANVVVEIADIVYQLEN